MQNCLTGARDPPLDIGVFEVVEVPSGGREYVVWCVLADLGREGSHRNRGTFNFTLSKQGKPYMDILLFTPAG